MTTEGASKPSSPRKGAPAWSWGVAGAVVLPVLASAQYISSSAVLPLLWLVAGCGIAASGAMTAVQRGETSRKTAALIWTTAYVLGTAIYLLWPEYTEPLAKPGDVNYVVLPRQTSFHVSRILISPSQRHAIWRSVVALTLPLVLGAAVNGARLAPTGRKAAAVVISVMAWVVGVAFAMALAVFVGFYGVHFFMKAFTPPAQPVGLLLGTIVFGALSGIVAGAIAEGALDRYLSSRV